MNRPPRREVEKLKELPKANRAFYRQESAVAISEWRWTGPELSADRRNLPSVQLFRFWFF
jgi:hypothetical protein